MDVTEFFKHAEVDSRHFQLAKLIFALFAGNDLRLDFYEFIRSMFFFLSQSKTELAMFLFQLFDPDDSDSLTGDELRVLAKCINPGVTQSRFGRRYKRRNTNERKDLGYDYHHHYHHHFRCRFSGCLCLTLMEMMRYLHPSSLC